MSQLNDIDRINIELLGKKHERPATINASSETIHQHVEQIVDIFYSMLRGEEPVNHDIINPFNQFIHGCICHIEDEKKRRHINMDLDSIHEEDSEMDIGQMNRILYMSNDSKRYVSNGLMNIIRKNDTAS
jgi:hypothetical protein